VALGPLLRMPSIVMLSKLSFYDPFRRESSRLFLGFFPKPVVCCLNEGLSPNSRTRRERFLFFPPFPTMRRSSAFFFPPPALARGPLPIATGVAFSRTDGGRVSSPVFVAFCAWCVTTCRFFFSRTGPPWVRRL